MKPSSSRMPLIDALKGIAALIVLLHHLSAYGPIAEALRAASPGLATWLFEDARVVVQIFLVTAGFLAARALSPNGESLGAFPIAQLGQRYLRLSQPFIVAVSLSVACAALVRPWLHDDMVPAAATLAQWAAHGLLLHGVLGMESLSTGVWYVAIDFQLFAVFCLLLWAGRQAGIGAMLAVGLGLLSLFWFNRNPDLDNWAIYFFGSYMLGATGWWISQSQRFWRWLLLASLIVGAALLVDFRTRIAVSLVVSVVLAVSRRCGWLERWPNVPSLIFLGQISYSVFLTHFAVLMLANALYAHLPIGMHPGIATTIIVIVLSSLALGTLFHRFVEHPQSAQRLQKWLMTNGYNLLNRFTRKPEKA